MDVIKKFKAVIQDVTGAIQHDKVAIFNSLSAAKAHIKKIYDETSGAFNGEVVEVVAAPEKVVEVVKTEATAVETKVETVVEAPKVALTDAGEKVMAEGEKAIADVKKVLDKAK